MSEGQYTGQCLCGAHRFTVEGELQLNHHCHCGLCRKHHGSAFATLVGVDRDRLDWQRGDVIAHASSPDNVRESCATCGTALPNAAPSMPIFVPAGCLDDLEATFDAHIFVASKAPWYEIRDGLPTFDAFPPGVDEPSWPTREPEPGDAGVRGSCLCGDVRYTIEGEGGVARHCHCTRCRRARAAAHASNFVVDNATFRFTRGEELVRCYKLPEARYFTQCFCGRCGATLPNVDRGRGITIVPLGGLDDPPPVLPREHIWTADIPSWNAIHDALPQYEGGPPPAP